MMFLISTFSPMIVLLILFADLNSLQGADALVVHHSSCFSTARCHRRQSRRRKQRQQQLLQQESQRGETTVYDSKDDITTATTTAEDKEEVTATPVSTRTNPVPIKSESAKAVKCPDCNQCDGSGRIVGGIGMIAPWWPVKAYRPCPTFVARGGTYERAGPGLDELAFGRKGINSNDAL